MQFYISVAITKEKEKEREKEILPNKYYIFLSLFGYLIYFCVPRMSCMFFIFFIIFALVNFYNLPIIR